MNVMAGAAVCATLAGLGAAGLLFGSALQDGPQAVTVQSVLPAPAPEPVTISVSVPELGDLAIEPASPHVLPPSFALDITFASAPLRPSFIDGSPVFSADLGASEAIGSGEGAFRLGRPEPDTATPPEGPPLSGAATPPALARFAASTILQIRPPSRPAFFEAARTDESSPLEEPGPGVMSAAAAGPPLMGENGRDTPASPSLFAALTSTPSFEAPTPLASPFAGALKARAAQNGVASWYGPGFHGRRTASGERFNQNDLTAAHPHLPFGSRVRVVDERSGRSIVVRINDRGPFKPGRIIDLSKASAQALGMGGLARVKLVSAE